MNPYSVIIRPLLSEKSTLTREQEGKYTFLIQREADKKDVQLAMEKLFNVQVVKVQTLITRGKIRRRGMHTSLAPKQKKAIVTLAQGQKLNIFEDQ